MNQPAAKEDYLTFKDPIKARRSKKSHVYYVWSPKRGKTILLYGQLSLYYWIMLESDPTVGYFCERAFQLPIKGKSIIANFWTEGASYRFVFLTSEGRKDKLIDTISQCKSFVDFCTDRSIEIDVLTDQEIMVTPTYYNNWQTILQQLSANRDDISDVFLNRVRDYFQQYHSCSLGQLYALFECDPVIVRATVFELIRRHTVRYQNAECELISNNTIIEWNPPC